jgi:hypothetical protein
MSATYRPVQAINQHLGAQLHPCLGLNPAFTLAAIVHAVVKPEKAVILFYKHANM